jgi:drug/metabolite transporter (DMT)-like permease
MPAGEGVDQCERLKQRHVESAFLSTLRRSLAASVHGGSKVLSNDPFQTLSETIMIAPLPSSWNANLGFSLAVLAAVLWGLTYCLDERVLASLSIFKLYFLHCLCGVLVAGGIMLIQGDSPAGLIRFDTAKASLPLVGLTLVTATAAALAILGSIQLLGANKSAVLEISYPLFVAIFSVWLFKGELQLPVVVGGGFIFIGAAIIVLAK